MFKKCSIPFLGFVLMCLFFNFVGCKKDPNSLIGDNLQPGDELLQPYFSDTAAALDIISFTSVHDSLLMQKLTTALLGTMNDPVFGVSTYNYVADLHRDILFELVPEGSTLDSVILELAYSSSFRLNNSHKNTPLTINIIELGEALIEDSSYFTYEAPVLSSTKLLSNYTFTPNPFDTLPDSNRTVLNSLKLKLSNDFGHRLMQARADDYIDGTSCSKFFKGLYLQFDKARQQNSGNIFSFNTPYNKGTGVVVYYKKPNDTLQKEAYFFFGPTAHTYIERDRTNAAPDFKAQIAGDTSKGQQRVYIQSTGGALMQFKLPNIKELSDHKIIVNYACLVMKNAQFDQGVNLDAPGQLVAYVRNDDNTISDIPDRYNPGGVYDSKTGEYRLVLTRYIQEVITKGTELRYITVAPKSQFIDPNQVILYGPDKSLGKNRMRIELIYTQIPK